MKKEHTIPQQGIEDKKNREECVKGSTTNTASDNPYTSDIVTLFKAFGNENLTIFECFWVGIFFTIMLSLITVLIGSIWSEGFWSFWTQYAGIFSLTSCASIIAVLVIFYSNKKISEEEIASLVIILSLILLYVLVAYFLKESGLKPEDMPQLY